MCTHERKCLEFIRQTNSERECERESKRVGRMHKAKHHAEHASFETQFNEIAWAQQIVRAELKLCRYKQIYIVHNFHPLKSHLMLLYEQNSYMSRVKYMLVGHKSKTHTKKPTIKQ